MGTETYVRKLHNLEKSIFREFAQEASNNIHVDTVELGNPLTSLYKILLCDIITSQMYFDSQSRTVLIPKSILVEDKGSMKIALLEFNEAGISYLVSLFDDLTFENSDATIVDFRDSVLQKHSGFYTPKLLKDWTDSDQDFHTVDTMILDSLKIRQNPIKFTNEDYPKIRKEEIINYEIWIDRKFHLKKGKVTKNTVDSFLTKLSTLAIHTLRNKRVFAQIETLATKAAISAVMARNMSHNIGSHVLSKLVSKEGAKRFWIKEDEGYKPAPLQNRSQPNKVDPEEALAYFNSYLRTRMDYLADIATGVPVMEVTRNLIGDVVAGLDKNRILLNYISGVDGFKFEILIRDCRNCKDVDCNCTPITADIRDIPISMPNDVLGYHAVYVIIENLIRNTAKHGFTRVSMAGNRNEIKPVQFVIEVRNCDADSSLYV
jgi:hypothetical protein